MKKLGLVMVLALAPMASASAQDCAFSGSGVSGNDCYGQGWVLDNGGWGIPGIFHSIIPFAGASPATEFHITFNASGSFNGLIGFGDGHGGGFNTQFDVSPFGGATTYWTVSGSGNNISFFAPAGQALDPGENFYVNIQFLNGLPQNLADVSFNASWGAPQGTAVTPEPATMTLLATGLAGMAAARRRRKA